MEEDTGTSPPKPPWLLLLEWDPLLQGLEAWCGCQGPVPPLSVRTQRKSICCYGQTLTLAKKSQAVMWPGASSRLVCALASGAFGNLAVG